MGMWKDNVDRYALHKMLELPDKLPADYENRFEQVALYSSRLMRPEDYMGLGTVIIHKSVPRSDGSKSSTHRVFILCPCGREIPAGRTSQHKCKKMEAP
jgi:hypothetical protein